MLLVSCKRYCILFGLFFFLAACSAKENQIELVQGSIMGTEYHVKYVNDTPNLSQKIISRKVFSSLQKVDKQMSTYKPKSELMRFNNFPVGKPFAASKELLAIIERSQHFSKISHGAFDVTIGPLVNLWGFGPQARPNSIPASIKIQQVKQQVGSDKIIVDSKNSTLTKTASIFVDLSAIAKGYGVDQVAKTLDSLGIHNYMVEVGGELHLSGKKTADEPWRVGIERPDKLDQSVYSVIVVNKKGVATSGDYRNYYEVNGKRYSHTIDPRTGYPVTNKLASVTVVADSTENADAIATLLSVLGEKAGLQFAQDNQLAAYFIYHCGNQFCSAKSQAFLPYLRQRHRNN